MGICCKCRRLDHGSSGVDKSHAAHSDIRPDQRRCGRNDLGQHVCPRWISDGPGHECRPLCRGSQPYVSWSDGQLRADFVPGARTLHSVSRRPGRRAGQWRGQSGAIPLGDLDMWNFAATAGDNFTLRVGSTNFTPWIRVYGPSGALVGETTSGNTFARDGFVSMQATNAGNYSVVVSAAFAGQAGEYASAPGPGSHCFHNFAGGSRRPAGQWCDQSRDHYLGRPRLVELRGERRRQHFGSSWLN